MYLASGREPAWTHRVIVEIQNCDFAEIALVMRPDRRSAPACRRSAHALYNLYAALDKRIFRTTGAARGPLIAAAGESARPDASALCDVDDLLQDPPWMTLPRADTAPGARLTDATVAAIARHDLDVAISLVPNVTLASDRRFARHGMWSLHIGGGDCDRGQPGFWEVLERAPVTESSMRISMEGSGDQITRYQSFSSTDKFSVARNSDPLWRAGGFVLRLLRDIHDEKLPARDELARDEVVLPQGGRRRDLPRNREMARLMAKHAAAVAVERLRHKVFPERWVMAYTLGSRQTPLREFQRLEPPEPVMWADPFPVLHDGTYYLFFEEQDRPGVPAHIAVMRMRDDGGWEDRVTVLEQPYHLSYPNVFQWKQDFYMIPETLTEGRVELFRATDFPYVWQKDSVLLDGIRAVDVTLTERDGLWWMFLNSGDRFATNLDELQLYSAPSPLGRWAAHDANPLRVDARNTRSAGRIFDWHGRLIRPTQDCGERYGRAIRLNEIVRLDEDGLEEREVARIEPDWDRDVACVHTFNRIGDLTVIDCLRRQARRPRSNRTNGNTRNQLDEGGHDVTSSA